MQREFDEKNIETLREVLCSLDVELDREYLNGQIFIESDVVTSIVLYLRRALEGKDGTWIIGSNHQLGKKRPDILCYCVHENMAPWEIYKDRQHYLVGILEVKYANANSDRDKLENMQSEFLKKHNRWILIWNVFGDHFNSQIHKKYFERQCGIEAELSEWVVKDEPYRGSTLMKCGVHRDGETEPVRSARETLNRTYWILDRNSKKLQKEGKV